MSKSKKIETGRICVTLPVDMLQNFRILSDETDLSISRLIYLRLRSREPILVVTNDMLREIQTLRELVTDIKHGNYISHERLYLIETNMRQIEQMINFDSPTIVVHVRKR